VLVVIAETAALLSLARDEIGWPRLLEVGAAVVALSLAKPPYLLVAALVAFPAWRHRGRIAAALGGAGAVAVACGVAWSRWAQAHYVLPDPRTGRLGFSYAYHDVSPTRQSRYVREHPWGFVKTIGHTLARDAGSLVRDAFAQSPSWQPSRVVVTAMVVLVALALGLSPRPFPGGWRLRAFGFAIAAVIFVALFFLAYVGWNAVAAPRVDAFQGRYLLPVVALLVVVVAPGLGVDRPRADLAVIAGSAAVALAVAVGIAGLAFF
jgi:hypothetical protein